MYREEDDDRFERYVSMALVPIGAVFALLWILVFYCVIEFRI